MAVYQSPVDERVKWLTNDAEQTKTVVVEEPLAILPTRARLIRAFSTATTSSSAIPELSDGDTASSTSTRHSDTTSVALDPLDAPLSPTATITDDQGLLNEEPLNLDFDRSWRTHDEAAVKAPFEYVSSLPQGGFRSQFVKACNIWFGVSKEHCQTIDHVVGMLHNGSLIIDDIQDGSKLRRGVPVTHAIFGIAQAINAANYVYFQAQHELMKLPNWQDAIQVFTEELMWLHRGQGIELFWRDTVTVPTMDEYLQMVSNKTGGLFRLILRLLQAVSGQHDKRIIDIVDIVGLIYQVLDDYKNLLDGEMAAAKGYCEDLTEGKFSFPMVHALSMSGSNEELLKIIRSRTEDNAIKAYAVQRMEHETGSFEYTRKALDQLHCHARHLLSQLDRPNPGFDMILAKLAEKQAETKFRNEAHSVAHP